MSQRVQRGRRAPDAGWLYILAGLVMCAAVILLPAEADRDRVRLEVSRLHAEEAALAARLQAYSKFIDDLDDLDDLANQSNPSHLPDPHTGGGQLLRRLAAQQLNVAPSGDEPVVMAASGRPSINEWIEASIQPAPTPEVQPLQPSLLSRIASGPRRLWIMGYSMLCVFAGLLMSPGLTTRRRVPERGTMVAAQKPARHAFDDEQDMLSAELEDELSHEFEAEPAAAIDEVDEVLHVAEASSLFAAVNAPISVAVPEPTTAPSVIIEPKSVTSAAVSVEAVIAPAPRIEPAPSLPANAEAPSSCEMDVEDEFLIALVEGERAATWLLAETSATDDAVADVALAPELVPELAPASQPARDELPIESTDDLAPDPVAPTPTIEDVAPLDEVEATPVQADPSVEVADDDTEEDDDEDEDEYVYVDEDGNEIEATDEDGDEDDEEYEYVYVDEDGNEIEASDDDDEEDEEEDEYVYVDEDGNEIEMSDDDEYVYVDEDGNEITAEEADAEPEAGPDKPDTLDTPGKPARRGR